MGGREREEGGGKWKNKGYHEGSRNQLISSGMIEGKL